VEALVRWRHPTRGLLYPDSFIELAEQAGLMKPLTLSVLDQALAQSARWRADGLDLAVAVNVSPSNLVDLALPDQVADLLDRYGLPTSALTLEVTEAILMQERERAMAVLSRLRSAGVGISIDDYGTGYSSLAYLAELPVTELKLDRSFVSRIVGDAGVAAIVRSTIDLAHALGLVLVAEGVEDEASLVLLATFGCDVAQGYHLSRPLAADPLTAWLHTREDRPLSGPAQVPLPSPREALAAAELGEPEGSVPVAAGPPAAAVDQSRGGQPTSVRPGATQLAAAYAKAVTTLGHDRGFLPSLLFAAVGIAVIVASRWLPDGPQLALLSLTQIVGRGRGPRRGAAAPTRPTRRLAGPCRRRVLLRCGSRLLARLRRRAATTDPLPGMARPVLRPRLPVLPHRAPAHDRTTGTGPADIGPARRADPGRGAGLRELGVPDRLGRGRSGRHAAVDHHRHLPADRRGDGRRGGPAPADRSSQPRSVAGGGRDARQPRR
jgi:EAL domain-containing protein (putative c-di-GMP-specific phosphodiesterase class I)